MKCYYFVTPTPRYGKCFLIKLLYGGNYGRRNQTKKTL